MRLAGTVTGVRKDAAPATGERHHERLHGGFDPWANATATEATMRTVAVLLIS